MDSKTEEDNYNSFSLNGMHNKNNNDNNSKDVINDNVSESKSSIYTSSDKEPITEDLAFIVLNIYKSNSKDTNSNNRINKEDAHVGYIKGNSTFILLVRYKDLMLKLSLKLYILRKHTVKRLARYLRFGRFS